MAGITFFSGLNMIVRFADSSRTVMASRTGAYYFVMINIARCNRNPWRGSGCMAGFAVIGGVKMRVALTNSCRAVVTTCTGAQHLVVIDVGRRNR